MPPLKLNSMECAGSLTPELEGSARTEAHAARVTVPKRKPPKETINRGEHP